jgi:vanillate/3-O-methylgallate O-demethylase
MTQPVWEVFDSAGNAVHMLRHSQIGAYVYPVVPSEFTNWRDEQCAWQKTAVLFDQSHHMAEITVTGPDALKLMSTLTINSFNGFTVNKAKQMVPISHDGYVIGDGICFTYENGWSLWAVLLRSTGSVQLQNRRFQRTAHPRRSFASALGKAVSRRHYRYQIQGPNAKQIIDKLNGGPMADVKFFNMDYINMLGRKVRCLRHGMAGAPGLEIWGPYAEAEEIREHIMAVGREFGLVRVGSRAYSSNTFESGWIPSPPPGVSAATR